MKKLISALLCSSMLLGGAELPVLAQEEMTPMSESATIIHSGKIGTADWTIDANGTLTIGAGELTNNDSEYEWPWKSYLGEVTHVDGTAAFKVIGSLRNAFSAGYGNENSSETINLSGWNISQVTDMCGMFEGCSGLTSLDLSSFDTSQVTDMNSMFFGCSSLNSLNLSGWNTSQVTDMNSMFTGCRGLTSLNLSGWNTSQVTGMSFMFCYCDSLTSLDLSGWNTSQVIYMTSMFSGCGSLTSLDVSHFDTSQVIHMTAMFQCCNGLTSLDLSGWNTSQVTGMICMFEGCNGLTSLDLSGWNTSQVTAMDRMFTGCSGLTSLDLSGWNTSQVIYMTSMFSGCDSLTSLDLSSFDTASRPYMDEMFYNCPSLANIRYPETARNILTKLPQQSGWYQDGFGPYTIQNLPAVTNGKTALLSRTGTSKPNPPQKTNISSAKVTGINTSYQETGSTIAPKPKVELNGKVLNEGTDYALTYSNNIKPGKATITITGIGNYQGTKAVTFTITAKKNPEDQKPPVVPAKKVIMHRLYNPNSGEHFYTSNDVEKNHLVSVGWKYEGEGWKAPEKSSIPVYRLYNPNAGDHHYTLDKNEKDTLVKIGWNDEGIGWYSDEAKGVPLYRQYNPNAKAGSHNYTTDKNENDGLVKLGWKEEGIGWYGMK